MKKKKNQKINKKSKNQKNQKKKSHLVHDFSLMHMRFVPCGQNCAWHGHSDFVQPAPPHPH